MQDNEGSCDTGQKLDVSWVKHARTPYYDAIARILHVHVYTCMYTCTYIVHTCTCTQYNTHLRNYRSWRFFLPSSFSANIWSLTWPWPWPTIPWCSVPLLPTSGSGAAASPFCFATFLWAMFVPPRHSFFLPAFSPLHTFLLFSLFHSETLVGARRYNWTARH